VPVYWREALKGRWAVIVYSDPYTMEQFEQVMAQILAHPISRPALRLLIDRRYCSAPLTDFVQRMVAYAEKHQVQLAGSRAAAVVSTDAMYGMGRMLEGLVEAKNLPHEVRTFRDWDEAERWLQEEPPGTKA
jgi:SpoIIAA-like